MKVLLINPLTRGKNVKRDRTGVNYPLGVGYIGAYLQEKGHEVTILDNNQKCYEPEELKRYLLTLDVDLVGISSMANTYNQVLQLSKFIKELLNVPIILGGALPAYSPRVVLENMDVDVCVMGEGEETAGELLERWPEWEGIKGIAYLDQSGHYVENEIRIPKLSRDAYPYPGYDDLIDISKYWRGAMQSWEAQIQDPRLLTKFDKETHFHADLKIATMLSGMGCPYKCSFCTNSTPFMKTRERSPESIGKEAIHLKEKFGIDAIRFDDDLLILQKNRSLEIAREMKKTGLFWSGQAVGRSVTDEQLIKTLADSNCVGFGIGVESGSNRLLKAMLKGSRTHHYIKALELAKKYGLGIRVQILYGVPGEDKTTLKETVEFFKSSKLPPRRFNKLFPMPGSGIYDQCIAQDIITNEHDYLNWSSRVSGYTSKTFHFNITKMTDKEYEENVVWAEKQMERNYKWMMYKDPGFWAAKFWSALSPEWLIYYGLRVLKVYPVLNRISGLLTKVAHRTLVTPTLMEKNIGSAVENTMNSVTRIYPELAPNPERPGFKNKPLVDKRIEQIMVSSKYAPEAETGEPVTQAAL